MPKIFSSEVSKFKFEKMILLFESSFSLKTNLNNILHLDKLKNSNNVD